MYTNEGGRKKALFSNINLSTLTKVGPTFAKAPGKVFFCEMLYAAYPSFPPQKPHNNGTDEKRETWEKALDR